jgi:hypothetical protein
MKKSTLILAGVIAFDLGVMVVASQAAQADYFLKIDGFRDGKKAGTFPNADACKVAGGKVERVGDKPQCQLPTKVGGSGAKACAPRTAKAGPTVGGTPTAPQDDCNSTLQGVSTTR